MELSRLVDRLRGELEGYTVAGVAESVGRVGLAALDREQRAPAIRHACALPGRIPLLTRLLLLGHQLTEEEYTEALPTIPLDEAIDAGFMTEHIKAAIAVRPVAIPERHGSGELLIASDLGPLQDCLPAHDHVMPVGGATKTLAAMTAFDASQHVLDLGTGCGYHALVAARSGANAVAVDISERALAFTQFNAAMAGLTVETRQGSLFEPVPEKFDRIVANLPFVITPPEVRRVIGTYEYRDAGAEGDDILMEVLANVGNHLSENGIAWLLGNWLIHADLDSPTFATTWSKTIATAIGNREAWIVLRDAVDPAQYAEMWLKDTGMTGSAFTMAYFEWLKNIAAESIGFGCLTLGPQDGPQRFEDYRGSMADSFGDAWRNRHLAASEDDALLATHLVANGLVEKRLHTPGVSDPWHISLLGLGREVPVSGEVAGFVGACDGELSVGQIIGALSGLLNTPVDEMMAAILPSARELIGAGLLVEYSS
ncbi:DUF7059 domain-containing protein [Flaviflexus huanghaiensis]|uniref:DUF7059 domain-containing protein n=1 Tax=Flaviflexus huanghaiensis TaxID=1111473 RepID=UPI0015F9B075|nr:class I SAM-dependent methyltransferase [Flaviflexus huanghaiensis]